MKPSYFTTPRTLSDATFHVWGEAIEKQPSGISHQIGAILWAMVLGIVGAAFLAHWLAS